jgi:formate hydrogenlyase subunit 6/NADH:ubiquinone oxidoreductase subunit I
MSDRGALHTSGPTSRNEVLGQGTSAGEITRRELFRMVTPRGVFPSQGRLTLDRTKCSACVLCAQECSTGALAVEGTESVRLVFREELCDSCGLCVEVCPEQCLTLEHGRGNTGEVVLFEDEFARCTRCGVVIGSRAMIGQVSSKLGKVDAQMARELWLCPACKVKDTKLSRSETEHISRKTSTIKDDGHA